MKQDDKPMGENGWDTWLVARYPIEAPQLADEDSEDEDPIVVLDEDSGEEADAECDMDTSYDSVFDWGVSHGIRLLLLRPRRTGIGKNHHHHLLITTWPQC